MNEVYPVIYCDECNAKTKHIEKDVYDSEGDEQICLCCDICGEVKQHY